MECIPPLAAWRSPNHIGVIVFATNAKPQAAHETPMIGDRLGKWSIYRELGRGGMGRVYLAQEELTGRKAALKILAVELAQDPGFLQRFQHEIADLSLLSHPNIVQFYEAGFENGLHFYAMEYVEGQNLDDILTERGKLPWSEVLDIARQICPPLRHVHDHGIIHRDLKPPNILRDFQGRIKLTDFGIAKVFSSHHLTATGGVVGTADYLSPEQAAGKPVTKRSDLYSLGVVLYQLLTGRTPFSGTSMVDLLHKHRYGQFDRPGRLVPELPYEIDEIVCQLLEKEPSKRPADALVLGKTLEGLRRKLDRKSQNTSVSVKEPTVADNRDGLELPGPATLMSQLVREEIERQNRGSSLGRFFVHPLVLLLLLLGCLAIFAYALWPLSADELFAKGESLMARDHPIHWQEAWRDYFDPLEARFPNHPYKAQLDAYRKQRDGVGDPAEGEAQRLFLRGKRARQEGDYAEARRLWRNLIAIFEPAEGEKKWVDGARDALTDLDREAGGPSRWQTVRPALDRARALAKAGQRAEAEKIWNAIEDQYRDDPWAGPILAQISQARREPP